MKPTNKSKEIDNLIKDVIGIDRRKVIKNNTCAFCVESNFEFRNAISVQEYRISGLCQNCQDEVFGNGQNSKED
jgi:hypothetical protein